jgi:hypothetical protein
MVDMMYGVGVSVTDTLGGEGVHGLMCYTAEDFVFDRKPPRAKCTSRPATLLSNLAQYKL